MVVYPFLFIACHGEHLPGVKATRWIPSFAWQDPNLSLCSTYQPPACRRCRLKASTVSFSSCLTLRKVLQSILGEKHKRRFCKLVVGMLRSNGPWSAVLVSKSSYLCSGVSCKRYNRSPEAEIRVQDSTGTRSCSNQVEARLHASVQVIKMIEWHQDWDVSSAFQGSVVATALFRKMCYAILSLWF